MEQPTPQEKKAAYTGPIERALEREDEILASLEQLGRELVEGDETAQAFIQRGVDQFGMEERLGYVAFGFETCHALYVAAVLKNLKENELLAGATATA